MLLSSKINRITLKIAIVGTGRWGRNHVRVLKRIMEKNTIDELVLVDPNLEILKRVSKQYGIEKYYTDVIEMKKREKPDAAIIAVPTILHYKIARVLLDSMDLLIEKPISSTLNEAKEIIEIAEKENRIVAVGHIERFNPAITALKENLLKIIKQGNITFINGERIGPGPPSSKSETYLSVAHDLMVHDIDIVVSLLGTLPTRVTAWGVKSENYAFATELNSMFIFPSDIQVFLRASWRSSPTFKKRTLTIHAHDTVITIDYILQSLTIEKGLMDHSMAVDYYGLLAAYKSREKQEYVVYSGDSSEPLLLEDLHFINCVKKRIKPLVSAVEGYIALKNVLMALKAYREKRWLEIEWDEPFIYFEVA